MTKKEILDEVIEILIKKVIEDDLLNKNTNSNRESRGEK